MKKRIALLFFLAPLGAHSEPRLGYISFGPMVHWNSRNDDLEFSYGFEISYWNYAKDPGEDLFFANIPNFKKRGYGLDLGLDWGNGKRRIYSEAQLEWNGVGASMGPVVEKRSDEPGHVLGFQGSVWSPIFFFTQMRYRHIHQEDYVCLGLYGKLPVLVSAPKSQ